MDRQPPQKQPRSEGQSDEMKPQSRSSSPPQYAPSSHEQPQMYSPQGQQYHSNPQMNFQQGHQYPPNPQQGQQYPPNPQQGQQYQPNPNQVHPYLPNMQQYGPPPPQQHFMQSQQQVVIVQQPAAQGNKMLVCAVNGHRDWSSGLCGCCSDFSSMCKTMHCLACALCDISSRTGDCMCTALCIPGTLVAHRTRIRTLGGIQGSICYDSIVVGCCFDLAVCQMLRELDAMGL